MDDDPDSHSTREGRRRAKALADAQLDVVYGRRDAPIRTPWGAMSGSRIAGEFREIEREHRRVHGDLPTTGGGSADRTLLVALLVLIGAVAVIAAAFLGLAWLVLG